MVEKSDVMEECSSCVRLKQEIEIARKDQAATLKMIKEKIMSTDKLIRKYQRKCDDFDKQTKLLNDLTSKHGNCERNTEILQEQLKQSLEVTEPQKKTITRLIQEKFKSEERIQEWKLKNAELEEATNKLRYSLHLRDEKDASWKLEQQLLAKQIEKEKKRVEKLTKDLEKAKEEIKKGKVLVREKNRELRSFGRKCETLEFQLKNYKEELKRAQIGANDRSISRKLSPKEVKRTRRLRRSAQPSSDSPEEQDIALNGKPSLTSIFDEMAKLDVYPVLSPVPPSPTDQDNIPGSNESSSESSEDHSSNSSYSSSDGEDGSLGDLGEMLQMELEDKHPTRGEAGAFEDLDVNIKSSDSLESDVSRNEDVGEKTELLSNANDDEICSNSEQTILENSDKDNTLDSSLEETSSSFKDTLASSSKMLLSAAESEASPELNTCDTQSKDILSMGSDKEAAEQVDIENNNLTLSSLNKDFKGTDFPTENNTHLFEPESAMDDDDETAGVPGRDDGRVKDKPCSKIENHTEDETVLISDGKNTTNSFEFDKQLLQKDLEVDSGKEDADGNLSMPFTKLKTIKKSHAAQVKCILSMTADKADTLSNKTAINKSREILEKTLPEKHSQEVELEVANKLNEIICLLENDLDNGIERDMLSFQENSEQLRKAYLVNSDKVGSDSFVKQSPERTIELHQSLRSPESKGLSCKSTLYETNFSKRRIAHRPNIEDEKSGTLSEEESLEKIETSKQISKNTQLSKKSLSKKSCPIENDDNGSSEYSNNALHLDEGELGVGVDRTARKTKKGTTDFGDVETRKRQKLLEVGSTETLIDITGVNSDQPKIESKHIETTCQDTQKQLDSNMLTLQTSENGSNENNKIYHDQDGVFTNDEKIQVNDKSCNLTASVKKEKPNGTEDFLVDSAVSLRTVDNKVPLHKDSTNEELECGGDDTSMDTSHMVMDGSTEEVLDEGETDVEGAASSGQTTLDPSNDPGLLVDLLGDCEEPALKPESREDRVYCEAPGVIQDARNLKRVAPMMKNTSEKHHLKKYDCNSMKGLESLAKDAESVSTLIKMNKPDFTSHKEAICKSDNVKSKSPKISTDSLPLSSVIDDYLNVFDYNIPVLNPLPPSPISSRESSPTHELEPSLSLFTSFPGLSLSFLNRPSHNTRSVGRRVSQPSENKELKSIQESKNILNQDACAAEDSSLNYSPVEELPSKKPKKKRCILSVRPHFLSEIKYATKVLNVLTLETIKLDEVVEKLSSPRNMSNGTPFAATLVKFQHTEDLMSIIIQRYNDRDRQNVEQKSRLAHLNDWTPVLSVFEERVLELVTRLSNVDHFKGLSTKIVSLMSKSILHSCSVAEELDKRCVASSCRLLCALCRKESNLQRMRVLCYDIIRTLYSRPGTVLYLLISIAAVWPSVLSSTPATCTTPRGLVWISGESYQPLQCTIQTIVTTWARGNDWVLLGNVMGWLCAWKQVPSGVLSLQQLAEELVRLMKDRSFAQLMAGKDGSPILGFDLYEVVKALELVTCVLGWAWLNNVLVRKFLWDILTSWATRTHHVPTTTETTPPGQSNDSCNDAGKSVNPSWNSTLSKSVVEHKEDMDGVAHDVGTSSSTGVLPGTEDDSNQCCEVSEATVVAAIRLLGLICVITVQQQQSSIPQVMPLLTGILERAQDGSVPYAVQLASAYSLLEVSPWQPRRVASVLEKWKIIQDKSTNLPESLIQGLNSLKLCLQSKRDPSLSSKGSPDIEEKEDDTDIDSDFMES